MNDRNAAEALRGAVVRISREHFPSLEENEYYWVDLIGLSVFNVRGETLGTVRGLMDNGAHPVLRVDTVMPDGRGKELLIPFVSQYVTEVSREDRKICVDCVRVYCWCSGSSVSFFGNGGDAVRCDYTVSGDVFRTHGIRYYQKGVRGKTLFVNVMESARFHA